MPPLPPLSLYIHIPWCIKKCPYCDFNSRKLNGDIPDKEYVKHLLADLNYDIQLTSDRTVNTLFIGGGTPNLLSPHAIKSLILGIHKRLPIASNAEITIEVNPDNVTIQSLQDYKQIGINRISIGIQSFDSDKLISLGRNYSAKEAQLATKLVASLNLINNIDIMYGLPNQSLINALNDLKETIILAPLHFSWYQLTIERNTLFGSRPPKLPDDDMIWDILQQGNILLKDAGYKQYEISAYSKTGFQCQHNLNYWRFGDYLGIGCGAHGKLTQKNNKILRTVKNYHLNNYMKGDYLTKCYSIAPDDLILEYFMNRFRLLEPTPRKEFNFFTGLKENVIRSSLDQALLNEYIEENDDNWQITDKGKYFLNSLLELFIKN